MDRYSVLQSLKHLHILFGRPLVQLTLPQPAVPAMPALTLGHTDSIGNLDPREVVFHRLQQPGIHLWTLDIGHTLIAVMS